MRHTSPDSLLADALSTGITLVAGTYKSWTAPVSGHMVPARVIHYPQEGFDLAVEDLWLAVLELLWLLPTRKASNMKVREVSRDCCSAANVCAAAGIVDSVQHTVHMPQCMSDH